MESTARDRRVLAEIEDVAAAIVARAGERLLDFYKNGVAVEYKDTRRTDPVTVADRAVERQVREELASAFPDYGFLGEEGTSTALSSEYLWVLDPLDGTGNFAGRLPFFASSLALLRNGVPVVASLWVPYAPNLRAGVLRASFGNGARVGDEPLRVAPEPFRGSGPIAIPPSMGWAFELKGDLARRQGQARNTGSICYELAMVAGGGFQYAYFGGPKLWDVAAGVLLVREAGGHALTLSRGRWTSLDRFVAPGPDKDGKPRTLRHWSRAVLVGSPAAMLHVAPNLVPRRPPPVPVAWALRRQHAVRHWWAKRGKLDGKPGDEPGAKSAGDIAAENPATDGTAADADSPGVIAPDAASATVPEPAEGSTSVPSA